MILITALAIACDFAKLLARGKKNHATCRIKPVIPSKFTERLLQPEPSDLQEVVGLDLLQDRDDEDDDGDDGMNKDEEVEDDGLVEKETMRDDDAAADDDEPVDVDEDDENLADYDY